MRVGDNGHCRALFLLAGPMVAASVLTGCAGFNPEESAGPCLKDTKACIAERTALVRKMSSDPTRAWIGEPVGLSMTASGVRLFAYQNVRDKLSCDELAKAVAELDQAKQALAAGPQAGQTMLRHNEIKAMTDDVRLSLATSRSKRCEPGT
jgi:hypothetical protein